MSSELLALLALWIIPFLVFILGLRTLPSHAGLMAGISFGAIVSPASLGLYGLFYSGHLIGMLGLFSSFIHDGVTYSIGTLSGLIPERTVVEGDYQLKFLALSAGIWSVVYGSLGAGIDFWRRNKSATKELK